MLVKSSKKPDELFSLITKIQARLNRGCIY